MVSQARHPDEETLIALLDHELDGAERAAVDSHITTCSHCEEVLTRQERANRALAGVLAADLPAVGHADSIPVRWRVRPGVGAAGAGVLAGAAGALIVVGLLTRRRRSVAIAA